MKKYFLLMVLGLSLATSTMAQELDALLGAAEKSIAKGQYRKAYYYLKSYTRLNQDQSKVYYLKGLSLLQLNQIDSAKNDFRQAISLTNPPSKSYYYLGLIYQLEEDIDQAFQSIQLYVDKEPEDGFGYLTLAQLHETREEDAEAYQHYKRAYDLAPENPKIIHAMADAHYKNQAFDQCVRVSKKGLMIDPGDADFHVLVGKALLASSNFTLAKSAFEKAISIAPKQINYYFYKNKADILHTTDQSVLSKTISGQYKLTDVQSSGILQLDDWVTDVTHAYYYKSLMERFQTRGDRFGLDEYYMLYYGQTSREDYSPYADDQTNLRVLIEKEQYDEVIAHADKLFASSPMNINDFYYVSYAYFQKGNLSKFESYLRHYIGLVEGIYASGTGTTEDSAFLVVGINDEYALLNYLGYYLKDQSLHHAEEHNFDVFDVEKPPLDPSQFYFNIDKPFGVLAALDDKKGKKKKK